jgi:hypothetical protein
MADDYKSKLEKFFDLVPKSPAPTMINRISGAEYYGEVQSGTPMIPIPNKEALPAAKASIEKANVVENPKFETLTGLTHRKLLDNWKTGGLLTSCNAFVMKAGQAAGVKGLGGFNVEDTMISMGKRHCWMTPKSGETPQFGDVFETRSKSPGKDYENIHVGISLSVSGADWYTMEGGQGGPASGVDKVARIKKKYNTTHLLGWVDMRLLASGQPALPDWLLGNWMIYAGDQNYIYSFNRYGEVTQKAYQPYSGQNDKVVPNLDTGKILSFTGDTFQLRWDREGGVETFTYDRWNSFPGLNERMTGVATDQSAMKGVRL